MSRGTVQTTLPAGGPVTGQAEVTWVMVRGARKIPAACNMRWQSEKFAIRGKSVELSACRTVRIHVVCLRNSRFLVILSDGLLHWLL